MGSERDLISRPARMTQFTLDFADMLVAGQLVRVHVIVPGRVDGMSAGFFARRTRRFLQSQMMLSSLMMPA